MHFFWLFGRWPILALLIILIATIPLAPQELRYDVQIGYSGYFKKDELTPIWVTVANSEKHTQVRVVISWEMPAIDTYVQEISLPAPSVKKLVFYLRLTDYPSIWLQLQDLYYPKRSVSKRIEMRQASDRALWLIIQAPQKNWHFRHYSYRTATIWPRELPRHFAALGGVDIIMLSRPLQSRLSEKQITLLQDWVNWGGTLIVANSRQKMPGALAKIVVPNPRLQEYHCRDVGHGRVIAIADAVDNQSVSDRLNNKRFNRQVLQSAKGSRRRFSGSYYNNSGESLSKAFLRKVLKVDIKLSWVIWLLSFYLLAIGPCDYFLSKRSKYKTLTWINFSIMIVIFSFLAYSISRWFTSGPLQVATLNCLDLFPKSNRAIGHSFFGVYSTKNTSYHIETHPVAALIEPLTTQENSSGGHLAPTSLRQEYPYSVTSRIPIYSYKTYMATWSQAAPLNVSVVSVSEGHALVNIIMALPADLVVNSPVYVITARGYYEATKVSGFKWQGWRINKKQWKSILSTYSYSSKLQFSQGKNVLKYLSCANSREEHLRRFDRELNLYSHLEDGKAIVLLFVERPLTTVRLQGESPYYRQINLIRMVIPLKEQ